MVLANTTTFKKIRKRLEEYDEEDPSVVGEPPCVDAIHVSEDEKGLPSVDDLAEYLGVGSGGTMTNILRGKKVSYSTLSTKVMPALSKLWPRGVWKGFTLMDLIQEDVSTRILDDPEELRKFCYGYYQDHDRSNFGAVAWFNQHLKVRAARRDDAGNACLEGTLVNQHGHAFDFALTRLHNHLCVFRAIQQNGTYRFAGTYTHLHKGALCGTWSGLNLAWRPAAFRSLLSAVELKTKKTKRTKKPKETEERNATSKDNASEDLTCDDVCEGVGLFDTDFLPEQ
jgi:hypothetical protein